MSFFKDFWFSIVEKVEPKINRNHFVAWFNKTAVLNLTDNSCVIGVSNIFAKDWFASKYHEIILSAINEINPNITEVSYVLDASLLNSDEDGIYRISKNLISKKLKMKNQNRK